MLPRTLITFEEMRKARREWASDTIAFIPTMGALHAGHLSLVKQAAEMADQVVVSIFVNPMQFGPREDFSKYPRTLSADLDLLSTVKCDAVFTPNAAEMYPSGFQTKVINHQMAAILCGKSRPGHFDGVLTVVAKLFGLVAPTWAMFGKKDFQQWRLIELMVRDLAMNVRVVGAEIVREPDGLAMSSRNRYLAQDKREGAMLLNRALTVAAAEFRTGNRIVEVLLARVREVLGANPDFTIDYVEIRTADRLEDSGAEIAVSAVILAAAFYQGVRLIDNLELVMT